ncbi:alcohol dehydrogenase [Candidatus Hakubella thermalkaliphila]|uniref:Alcohol dehydrogenase n=1 Tax=Candidatus Hakubella thermalkaliphila TaxID=2754717 RepID=A0A6V8QDU7_9ACTN|nr:alcohol dehydrogenase [Candidatus Hakubella thermalkaliphila]GFP42932.1 alcohol dehydrogenase [Candidatus Hakubella thermalkaliphila]
MAIEVENLKCKKAFIVSDRDLIKSTDIPEKIKKALGNLCVGIFSDVEPDSGIHIVNQGAKLGVELGADCIVSVGGGSVIDTGKGMAILLKEGGRLQDYVGFQVLTRPQTPHIVIPTTAGTGSEVTYVAVIKDHEGGKKLIFGDYNIVPNVAILDPKMTEGLPPRLTAATGMDAMCHAIEALHSLQREPIADGIALHAIRLIKEFLPKAVDNGKDMKARGQMLIAANMAGIAFSNAQVGLVHALAHSVGAKFKVHHGLANSILLPACLRYNADACGEIYLNVLSALGVNIERIQPDEAGDVLADKIVEFTKKLSLPQKLRDVGVPEKGLKECSEIALSDGAIIYNPKFVTDSTEILRIYQLAW